MSDLAKHFAPLTDAEVDLVMRRMAATGRPEAEVVAEVKSERVGPAARWDAEVAEQQAQAAAAEESTATEPASADEDEDENLDDLEEADLTEGELVLLASTDDEFTAWLVETSVDNVIAAIEDVGEDSRPTAAIRVRDWETLRGSAARSTLLARVEPFAEEANS